MKWLRDSIRIIYDSAESDFFTSLVDDDQKQRVYVVPSFTGLGAPYWDSNSRGRHIRPFRKRNKREHIVKATLDSIAYQSNDLLKAMEKDLEKPIILLKVDGGASKSNYLMQFQSSISNLNVERPSKIETTGLELLILLDLLLVIEKT
ncbi:FGGY-family carbohydrate kinase [Mycoplasmopsis cynos]|nr:FGGY-family carbohydrate kinase [Mycoplasmopsis cynos]